MALITEQKVESLFLIWNSDSQMRGWPTTQRAFKGSTTPSWESVYVMVEIPDGSVVVQDNSAKGRTKAKKP